MTLHSEGGGEVRWLMVPGGQGWVRRLIVLGREGSCEAAHDLGAGAGLDQMAHGLRGNRSTVHAPAG